MKDLVEKYLKIYSELCAKQDDYTKKKVKRHNNAIIELNSFVEDLVQDRVVSEKVFYVLLDNKDIGIQTTSSAYCLKYGILMEKAEKTLEKISKSKVFESFGAEMTLKVWRGEIPGKIL